MNISINDQSLNTYRKTPSFQANYIVKGSADDIHRFHQYVINYPEEICHINIIPEYSKDMPYMEVLFSTRDDREKLSAYSLKFFEDVLSDYQKVSQMINSSMEEDNSQEDEKIVQMLEYSLDKYEQKQDELMAPYIQAQRAGRDAMNDFMIDEFFRAGEKVVEILGKEEASKVQKLDVKEVLKAVKEGRFDFINGKIG